MTTLDFPLSAEAQLLLISRGPNSSGTVDTIEIVTSPKQDQNVATVRVIVSHSCESARNIAKVCRILRRDGAIGVGIFVSRMNYDRDIVHTGPRPV